ncbi:MAG: hypothetical protein VX127_03695 [Myxococcota bacterium]|nr:hypothetical protein [Myxococcota bacterium]
MFNHIGLVLTAVFVALAPHSANAAPADLIAIQRASVLIEDNPYGKEADMMVPVFTKLVVDQAIRIADQQGIAQVSDVRSPAFSKSVSRVIKGQVSAAAYTDSDSKRKLKWYELLRNTSTSNAGHRALASWLDFEAPGSYLKKEKRGTPPRITKQVWAESTDERLKIEQDAIKLGGEIGGAGEGNGLIDAGEWVQLGLEIYNASDRGFFSSSGWLETGADCAWVPPALETVMSELPATPVPESPDAKPKKPLTQSFAAWVYLSTACADNSVVPLKVRIKDTHRAPRVPIVLSAKMVVRNRVFGKAERFLVDTDIPGVSDGKSMPTVEASRVFELTHGFAAAQRDVLSARTGWGIHKDVGAIISQQKSASNPMIAAGGGRFLPGDDLDIATMKPADYDQALQARADDERWESLEDARAWFAADTEVLYETPDPPMEVVEKPPEEICNNYLDDDGDGKHDCQDSDCKAERVCNPASPVAIGSIMSLIKRNIDIVPNPASPTVPGAVQAVEPGYEVVLDSKVIGTQYACLVEGVSPAQCTDCEAFGLTLQQCKTCINEGTELRMCGIDASCDEEKAEEEVEVDTGRTPAIAYSYRNYFTLPLDWNPNESNAYGNCEDGWDNDLDGLPDSRDEDCVLPEICNDGIDNDRDGKVDREDYDCATKEVCDDGFDNDLDGKIDSNDSDCRVVESLRRGTCDDGIDNDQDGKTDRRDEGCQDKDPFGHRTDLGVLLGQTTFTDQDDVEWSSPGGWTPMVNLRYVLVPRGGGSLRPIVSYAWSRPYDIVHNDTDYVQIRSYGAGMVFHKDLSGGLALELRGLFNKRTFVIAPDSEFAIQSGAIGAEEAADSTDLLSATVSNWGPELGLELHYGFDFGLGIYAGVGAVLHGSVQSGGAEVLSTNAPVATVGLRWNFGE